MTHSQDQTDCIVPSEPLILHGAGAEGDVVEKYQQVATREASHHASTSPRVSLRRSRSRNLARSPARTHGHSRRYTRSRSRSRDERRHRSHQRRRRSSERYSRSRRGRDRRFHDHAMRSTRESKTLGAFALEHGIVEQDLRTTFGRYGPVTTVSIVRPRRQGRFRPFAFITFESLDDARTAQNRLNGSQVLGTPIRVDFSITSGPKPSRGRRLSPRSRRRPRASRSPAAEAPRQDRNGQAARSRSPRRYSRSRSNRDSHY
ncbi:Transformer-2 protein alpha [Tieghemiomyces parasiticus]|uniref:Transformer-2 protein alpha n=1 Tax=Tieghemiomyces parasiticus TaxID=78921 RepID=A0A9W7ZQI9_9FUNG|nr:Transformer-2 protein alpha [Tieghemiomyces parasiticus]